MPPLLMVSCHVDRRARFTNRWGQAFPAVPSLPRGHPDELVSLNRGLDIVAGTCEPGTGEALDLADAVDALLVMVRPRAVGRTRGVTSEDTPSGH